MLYDLFISYARKDNTTGKITELKEKIESLYNKTTERKLKVFFDTSEIKGMDDFNNRILSALNESSMLLVILTSNHLESDYCNSEVTEYLSYEYARGSQNNNIAIIYFDEIEGFEKPDFEHNKAKWLNDVKTRQRIDLRNWQNNEENNNTKKLFDDLIESINDRIIRKVRIASSPGNLPAPNPRFVGRRAEMENLHNSVINGKTGNITIIHGLSGLGKTTLAIQYAWAYADHFFAGRYIIDCSKENNLAATLKKLEYDIEISFTDDERKNDELTIKKIINKLEKQFVEKSNEPQSKKYPIYPNILLFLDNVENPELIKSNYTDLITGKDWLKIIVTTRFGNHDFGYDEKKYTYIPVENLSDNETLKLLNSYCPPKLFEIDKDGIFANKIIKLLDGFTLAAEMTAIYLKEKEGRITFEAFYNRLCKEGCTEGIDKTEAQTITKTKHGKLISAALTQMFNFLTDNEKNVLNYCCLLPAETIPIGWIKELIIKEHPEFGEAAPIGYDDPWILLISHLNKLKLLQMISFDEDNNLRLTKMHRLVQEVLYKQLNKKEELTDILYNYSITRSEHLKTNWHHKSEQWEINPLVNFTELLLDKSYGDASKLVISMGQCMHEIYSNIKSKKILLKAIKLFQNKDNYKQTDLAILYSNLALVEQDLGNLIVAKDYLLKAIKIIEQNYEPNHPAFASSYSNLATVELDLGNLTDAKNYLLKAIKIDELNFEPNHPTMAIDYSNLAMIEKDLGNLTGAKEYLLKAINIDELNFEPNHPKLAMDYSNIAMVEKDLGNLTGAKEYLLKAINIDEGNFEPNHPKLAIRYSNLAMIERELGNLTDAKNYLLKAINIDEGNFEPNHPNFAISYSNHALVEKDLGNLTGAKEYLLKAIKIDEQIFEPNHPKLAIRYSNLALVEKDLGSLNIAKEYLLKAIKIDEQIFEPNHPNFAISYSNLATVEQDLGNLKEAEELFRKALNIFGISLPKEHPNTKTIFLFLIALLDNADRQNEATELRERAKEHGFENL